MDLGTAQSATGLLSFATNLTLPPEIFAARPARAGRRSLPSGSSAADHPPPPVQRLAAGGQVLLRRAYALEERECALAERFALAVEPLPRVISLAGVAREVVDLRLVVRAAQDQGPLARGHGQRHVVGDPACLESMAVTISPSARYSGHELTTK